MKQKFSLLILVCFPLFTIAGNDFNKYFKNSALRFDFLLGGNSREVTVYPQQMKQEPFWAGSKTQLTDPFDFGTYRFRIFDLKTDSLLFSKGFCTLFQEWQTTAEAKIKDKTFYQAAIFPFPKNKIRLEIDARQWEGNFKTIYKTEIDPEDYFILKETGSQFKDFRNFNQWRSRKES
jgi:hypothetical protein